MRPGAAQIKGSNKIPLIIIHNNNDRAILLSLLSCTPDCFFPSVTRGMSHRVAPQAFGCSRASHFQIYCVIWLSPKVYCVRAAAAPHVETFVLLRHFANRRARILGIIYERTFLFANLSLTM
jgi:hypothetical protein